MIGRPYDPTAWYWLIGGNAAQVYSSASAGLVPVADAGYVAFLATGSIATTIPSMAELEVVLAAQYPQGLPGGQYVSVLAEGCQVVSTATPAISGTYPLDVEHLLYVTSVATGILQGGDLPGGLPTIGIVDMVGVPHAMNKADFVNLALALRDYFAAVKQAATTIAGGGTAAWPAQPVTIA